MAPASRGTFAATPADPIKLYEYPTEVGVMLPSGASFTPPPRSVSITFAYLDAPMHVSHCPPVSLCKVSRVLTHPTSSEKRLVTGTATFLKALL
jgi:hypothetical protein